MNGKFIYQGGQLHYADPNEKQNTKWARFVRNLFIWSVMAFGPRWMRRYRVNMIIRMLLGLR